ncbi:Nuclear exosome regulator NRDE2-like protein [Drosera capensis]
MSSDTESPPALPSPPAFPISTTPLPTPTPPPPSSSWLRNTSFTVDLAAINNTSSSIPHTFPESDDDEDEPEPPKAEASNIYELLEEEDEEEDRKGKKKKRKKRRSGGDGKEKVRFGLGKRSGGVWSCVKESRFGGKEYCFDSRPDYDNLAFGSLYRFNVSRYKLLDSGRNWEPTYQSYSRSRRKVSMSEQELDIDAVDDTVRSSGRYWSGKYSAIERHKNLKRIRIIVPQKSKRVLLDDFIPLSTEDSHDGLVLDNMVVEESWEDEVLRKTKEFNIMTREHPRSVRAWLDFAEFQDKVAAMQPQKGARVQILEKKISILEKAVELNPGEEDLLLALLKAYQGRGNSDLLMAEWEKILKRNSQSIKLWTEFTNMVLRQFSIFKVSEQRRMYAHAIRSLSAACSKQRQGYWASDPPLQDSAAVELELGLVDMLISLCHFEWQAGYRELATALFQAEIEYSLFSPTLQLTEHSKQRLFEHFWNSNGPRVGEEGALGWSTWLEKEEEERQKAIRDISAQENEGGGWTGWFTLTKKEQNLAESENAADASMNLEETVDAPENEDQMQVDDDEALLKMMGIDMDAEANVDIKDSTIWGKWSEEETMRDNDQWLPLHPRSGASHGREAIDEEVEEQLSRVVLFEDVSEYVFSLSSEQAKFSLVSHISTNSATWSQKILSLEGLPYSTLQDLKRVHDSLVRGSTTNGISWDLLFPCVHDDSKKRDVMSFLRDAILLCLRAFPGNYHLKEAALIAEEQSVMVRSNAAAFSATPCQSLAKRLLKSDRQDLLLSGVYARREAAFGNHDRARKVFDMTLSSISQLPQESLSNIPILYFWYAEMELAMRSSGDAASLSRVLHLLHCLGCGTAYSPYKCHPSSVQLLKAHQGFKEQLKTVRASWASGVFHDSSVALICSASLFEELSAGFTAGIDVLSEFLATVLPETRRGSYHMEFLLNYYLTVVERHHDQAGMKKLFSCISHGLQIYPYNPQLFRSLLDVCSAHIVPNKLRQFLDGHFQKNPSVIALLFALSFELSKGGLQSRIHGLFERALAVEQLHTSVLLWRCYMAYEADVVGNLSAAKRIYFRAIHACPWSKKLWLDGFLKLNGILTPKELSDLQEVMRDKELNLRTDIYEILLKQDLDLD